MSTRLGVNIDHVATLRQQRGEEYPCLARAAQVALQNGADQITIHLREDRRHIQDEDVDRVAKVAREMGRPLNFEMGCAPDILQKALAIAPQWVCLVPERREERTTEGGLDLLDAAVWERVQGVMGELRRGHSLGKISLFVEANPEVLARAVELRADAVEIHTGQYARDVATGKSLRPHLAAFEAAARQLAQAGMGCHAGHGLTRDILEPLLWRNFFQEYNIGHWIISESVFRGLACVVGELKQLCLDYAREGEAI